CSWGSGRSHTAGRCCATVVRFRFRSQGGTAMRAELVTLPADTGIDAVLEVIERDGAAILSDVLDPAAVDRVLAEVDPYVEATRNGQDDFSGRLTTRTGALVARSAACRELILHPTVLAAAERFLSP